MSTTWKEIKQAYLLMLIKEGHLSNRQLDDMIGEAQRMTSDRENLKIATIEDMRRVVEAYNANPKYALIPDGMTHEQAVHALELGNAIIIARDANPDNFALSTEEAVRLIEHGPKALDVLKVHCSHCESGFDNSHQVPPCREPKGTCGTQEIIAKLEGK